MNANHAIAFFGLASELQTRKMISNNNCTFTNAPINRSITHTLNLFRRASVPAEDS